MFCMYLVWIGGGGRGMGERVSNGFILEMEMKLLCCQSKGWLIQWLAIMCKLLIILPPFLHISEDHCLLQHPGFQLLGGYWFGAPGGSGFISCHCQFFVKFQCLLQVIYHSPMGCFHCHSQTRL